MADNTQYKYYAFISYKSDDVKWAKWLQKKLERYSLPVALQKEHSLPKKLSPVFRDGTDILPRELKKELEEKIRQSKYLIVLCSPRSAQSEWVGDEIEQFCKLGRQDRVIALITEGTPYTGDPSTECYHPVLKKWFPKGVTVENDHQLLGADIHAAGPESNRYKRERAFIQIVATILQLPFDVLWNRRRKQLLVELTSLLAFLVGIVMVITFTWMAGRPFDVEVNFSEQTPHNNSLPFKDGKVAIVCDGDTLGVKQVSMIDAPIIFTNIPGKFKGKEAHIKMFMYGYQPVDTILNLSNQQELSICRDSTFAIFAGYITYEDGTTPAEDVKVNIGNRKTLTNDKGYFKIEFPVSKQSLLKHVSIQKEGYQTGEYDLQPQIDHKLVLFK